MKADQDPSTATTWLLLAGIGVVCGAMGIVWLITGGQGGFAMLGGATCMILTALRYRPRS
jgi:hypothetical protein